MCVKVGGGGGGRTSDMYDLCTYFDFDLTLMIFVRHTRVLVHQWWAMPD